MKIKPVCPWLDQYGNCLSEKELRVISKSWDQQTWDRYLDYYCSHEKRPQPDVGTDEEIAPEVSVIIDRLPTKQQLTIKKALLDNWSDSQIAQFLGVSKQTVFIHKKRAQAQLKANMRLLSDLLRIVRAQNASEPRIDDEEVGV